MFDLIETDDGELHLVPADAVDRHMLRKECYCQPELDAFIWHHRDLPVEMPGSSILNKKPAGALFVVGGTDTAP